MVYIITGGPGFGKTTLINLLKDRGFPVCAESARELLSSLVPGNEMAKSNLFPTDFEKIVANKRINFLQSADAESIAFSDRGLPDQVAYSWYKKKVPSDFISEKALNERYADWVFVTPPWEDIYAKDEIRMESFREATLIHGLILKSYHQFGYKTIDLPFTTPELRVRFILDYIGA